MSATTGAENEELLAGTLDGIRAVDGSNVASFTRGRLVGLVCSRLGERFADRGEQIVFQLLRQGKVRISYERRVLPGLVIFGFAALPAFSAPLFQPLVVSCRRRRFDPAANCANWKRTPSREDSRLPLRRILPGQQGIVAEGLAISPQGLMTDSGSLLNCSGVSNVCPLALSLMVKKLAVILTSSKSADIRRAGRSPARLVQRL